MYLDLGNGMMAVKEEDSKLSEVRYFIGLDLGQAQDPTALAVIERRRLLDVRYEPAPLRDARCLIPQLVRYPLGTSYPEIVADVVDKLVKAPKGTRLILDGTGVGRAVVDEFRQHRALQSHHSRIVPVTLTAGEEEILASDGYWRVPKRNLVGVAQVLLQSQRLKIAPDLAETQTLVKELLNFKVKITTAANDTYGAWREGQHDDLVLATALGCWAALSRQINTECKVSTFLR